MFPWHVTLYLGIFDWENTFSLYTIDDAAEVAFNNAFLSAIYMFVPAKVFSLLK